MAPRGDPYPLPEPGQRVRLLTSICRLYGHAICLWRRGDASGARAAFTRLCRLNPADQMAARLALDQLGRDGD